MYIFVSSCEKKEEERKRRKEKTVGRKRNWDLPGVTGDVFHTCTQEDLSLC
jgi:hypothetical protein